MHPKQKEKQEGLELETIQNEVKLLHLLTDAILSEKDRCRREEPLGPLQLTPQMIDEYLMVLAQEGKTKETIRVYRNILRYWYNLLPEEKYLTEDSVEVLARCGRDRAQSQKTIKNRVMVVRGFLKYLEYADEFRIKEQKEDSSFERVPRREEYYLILQAAKEQGYRRAYLIIKTIVCLGIKAVELDHMCVDGVTSGTILIPGRSKVRTVKVFEPLRTELLEYAAEQGVKDGPVFVIKEGEPVPQYTIAKELKHVHLRTGLPEYKGWPKNLYLLYCKTRKEIAKASPGEADQNYLALLQKEEATVGWNGDDKILIGESATLLHQGQHLFDKLSRPEEDRVLKQLGETLSEILSRKHGCKVTISYTRK